MSLVHRLLWLGTIVWGVSLFWISHRPPLIDLPQHAAQIALLSDVFYGQSRWSEAFKINFATPYLTTYALGWLLSLALPTVTAVKLLLSAAFCAFVAMLVILRKAVGSDPRLDWLALTSYFGFAWKWGFLSFLLSAPIGLLLIWVTLQYLNRRKPLFGILLVVLGLLLLISHGLIFAFSWAVALVMTCMTLYRKGRWLNVAWPILLCTVLCTVYLLFMSYVQSGLESGLNSYSVTVWALNPIGRLRELLFFSFDNQASGQYSIICCILFLIPFIFKSRLNIKNNLCLVPFGVGLLVFFLVPAFALKTAFLYQRFSLFLLPFWALLFIALEKKERPNLRTKGANLLLILCIWLPIYNHTREAVAFGKESADFEAVMVKLEPGKRALYLPIDNYSPADGHQNIYLHYGSWYQADKKGFVDFNFAWFPPQMLRFKNDLVSDIRPGFEFQPKTFDWKTHKGDRYDYFIFRSEAPFEATPYFRDASRAPSLLIHKGVWTVYTAETGSKPAK